MQDNNSIFESCSGKSFAENLPENVQPPLLVQRGAKSTIGKCTTSAQSTKKNKKQKIY